jgi:hypothetical protein
MRKTLPILTMIGITIFISVVTYSCQRDPSATVSKRVIVNATLNYYGAVVDFGSVAQELIGDALETAKVDQHPGFYQVLGTMRISFSDQTTESVSLFVPIGKLKRDSTYFDADFSKLRAFLWDKEPDIRRYIGDQ